MTLEMQPEVYEEDYAEMHRIALAEFKIEKENVLTNNLKKSS
jgi:hypothetical protein